VASFELLYQEVELSIRTEVTICHIFEKLVNFL
jgi:hypothetical protein